MGTHPDSGPEQAISTELHPDSRVEKVDSWMPGNYDDDESSNLTDVLADLRHWAHDRGLEFDLALSVSYAHYVEERHAAGMKD